MMHEASPSGSSHLLRNLAIAGTALAGGIILAPHILPALGVGSSQMAEEAMFVLHTSAESGGSGLAGALSNGLSLIPVVGPKLAEGGIANAATTAIVAGGGMLLGKAVQEREGHHGIGMGKIIQYAALATSALIALPTVLSALSTGLIFLSTLAGNTEFTNSVISTVDKTLGTSGGSMVSAMMGFSGAAAALPHFLTCGAALVPAALSYSMEESLPSTATAAPRVAVQVDGPTRAGQPCRATLTLKDPSGAPINADSLATVHTEKLHLMLVDESLRDYHHLHPHPTGKAGEFSFEFTPKSAGTYTAWADFTLKDGQNHRLNAEIPSSQHVHLVPGIRPSTQAEVAGVKAKWVQQSALKQDEASEVSLQFTDENGAPLRDLQPIMGAYAHMVGFSADGKTMVHSHPMGPEPKDDAARGGPELKFHLMPEAAGPTQFYVQVKRAGETITLPFGQVVEPAIGLKPAIPAQAYAR